MTSIGLDLAFPHQYDVELIEELPSTLGRIKQIHFSRSMERGGRGGLLVRVVPHEGTPWIGVFASGYASPKALTGVFSCPAKRFLCVVSAGAGYIIQADAPDVWDEVQAYPIVEVRPIPDGQLLVFVDFTSLVAYGSEGIVWVTPQTLWDGVRITRITSDYIQSLAWDPSQLRDVEFWVDIRTGHLKG